MPSDPVKGKDILDDPGTDDLRLPVKVNRDKAIELPELPSRGLKAGGWLARWFQLGEPSSTPTEHLAPEFDGSKPSIPALEKSTESEYVGERDDSFEWDPTAASSSKPKAKRRPLSPDPGENPTRRPSASASEQPSVAVGTPLPRLRRRSSAQKPGRRASAATNENNSKRSERTSPTALQQLLILETQEQNERLKKLQEEMAEKQEEIKEIKKFRVKNKQKLASEPVEERGEDEEYSDDLHVTDRQELGDEVNRYKEELKSELEEEMKAKRAQSRNEMDDMRTTIKNDYAKQAEALTLEYEENVRGELKPALLEAKMKVRQETANETQRFEAFVRAQVTHDCQKIDEECDQMIETVNRQRRDRQLAARQRGQETIEKHRNAPDKIQELDEKEKLVYSMVHNTEKERLQKQRDIIEADLAQREVLALNALEREAEQKLALARTLLEEQSRKKLQEYVAQLERGGEARIKSEKITQAREKPKTFERRRSAEKIVGVTASSVDKQGEVQIQKIEPGAIQVQQSRVAKARRASGSKQQPSTKSDVSQKAESSRTLEPLHDNPDRPTRSLIEEELLRREAKKPLKILESMDSLTLKKKPLNNGDNSTVRKASLKSTDDSESSAPKKGKKVLFEGVGSFKENGSLQSCICVKDGQFSCVPFVDTAVELIKQVTERPRGRSFAHPRRRESMYAHLARGNLDQGDEETASKSRDHSAM